MYKIKAPFLFFILSYITMPYLVEAAVLINGAGATFPYPIYSKWISEYQKIDADTHINYQSIGSGGGVRQLLEKTVDFGASDSPMTDEQISKSKTPIFHIPSVLGAVVLTYNLPGINDHLRLTGDIVSEIFLGKITQWDDPKIIQINPNLKLPHTDILVVHRSDGSGTTGIFTDYLSKVSSEWKSKVGSGTAVNWPVGLGGKGNEGVSGLIKQTPGSFGYVELIYAKNNSLPYAHIRNKAGQFIEPTSHSVSAAAMGALKTIPKDFRVSITHPDGIDSYPISGFTYLLVYQNMPKDIGQKLTQFLKWELTVGQKFAESLHYAPLPKPLISRVEAKLNDIQMH